MNDPERPELQKSADTMVSISPSLTQDKLLPKTEIESVVNSAANLTDIPNSDVRTISEIGDYQIWRDSNEIAIVDTKERKLVAHADVSNLFVEVTSKNSLNKSDLISRISESYPNIGSATEYAKPELVSKAKGFLFKIDPIQRNNNRENSQISQKKNIDLGGVFDKVTVLAKHIKKNLIENTVGIKTKLEAIATNLTAKKLMHKSLEKFESAHSKTGENKYSIDGYKIERQDNVFSIYDSDDKKLLSFKKQDEKLELIAHKSSLDPISNALKSIGDEKKVAHGDPSLEEIYKKEVFALTMKLNEYPKGKYYFEQADLHLIKKDNSLALQDTLGNKLLLADRFGVDVKIPSQKINLLNADFARKAQDARVNYASGILVDYLNVNKIQNVDKPHVRVSYDPNSKVLTFEDKRDSSFFIKAKHLGKSKGWENQGSNISSDRLKYFAEIAKKIYASQKLEKSISR